MSAAIQKQINDIRRGREYQRLQATGANFQRKMYLDNKLMTLERQLENTKKAEQNSRSRIIVVYENSAKAEFEPVRARRPKGPSGRAPPSSKRARAKAPVIELEESESSDLDESESSDLVKEVPVKTVRNDADDDDDDDDDELDKLTKYKLKELRENVKLLEEEMAVKRKAREELNKVERQLKEKDLKIKEKRSKQKLKEKSASEKKLEEKEKRKMEIAKEIAKEKERTEREKIRARNKGPQRSIRTGNKK